MIPMARARVEPPGDGAWGPRQALATQLRQLGYDVEIIGAGRRWVLVLSAAGQP